MRRVWVAAAVYAAVFSALEVYRWRIWSFGSDTGTFTQAVLDVAHGFRDGPEGGSHFFFHFSPILALLYPIVALTHSPLALQLVQVVCMAFTGPAMFGLVRPYCSERIAWRIALLALLYPPLAALAFGEFHELGLFPLLAIGLIWAADRCRWGWFAAIGILCVATREDVCLELAIIGAALAVFAWTRRGPDGRGLVVGEPRQPLVTGVAFLSLAIAAAVIGGAYYALVMSGRGHWPHSHFYDYPFASGPIGVIVAVITHPQVALPALATVGRLTYLLESLAPLAFLPLRSRWALLAIPGFVIVLLAAEQSVWRMGNHYVALWAPWLLLGAASTLIKLDERPVPRMAPAAMWSGVAIGVCVVVLIAFDPMHPTHYLTPPYADLASARSALACVPRDESVSTHDEWFAEIAADYPSATILATDGPRYLVYADDFPNDRFRTIMLPRLREDLRAGRYAVACSFGDVKAYKRNDLASSVRSLAQLDRPNGRRSLSWKSHLDPILHPIMGNRRRHPKRL